MAINDFLENGGALERDGIVGLEADGKRHILLHVESPYVIVDSEISASIAADPNCHTTLYHNKRRETITELAQLSPFWKKLSENQGNYEGRIPLGTIFQLEGNIAKGVPHYNFVLKFSFDGRAQLRDLEVVTTFQSARRALPTLRAGENTVNFYGHGIEAPGYLTDGEWTYAEARSEDLRIVFKYREKLAPDASARDTVSRRATYTSSRLRGE